jgi:hypothetical protein
MNEITFSTGEIISVLLIMAFTFVVAYSIGINQGRDEGFRNGFRVARNQYARRGDQ